MKPIKTKINDRKERLSLFTQWIDNNHIETHNVFRFKLEYKMLKKYQVAEFNSSEEFGVIKMKSTSSKSINEIFEFTVHCDGFFTAAEAQEMADELNEEYANEPSTK